MKPAESDMLPAEPDEQQKTIKKLEKELLQIKSRQPEMQLLFAGGTTVLKVAREGQPKSWQEMLAEKEAEWKKEFPKMRDAEMENNNTNYPMQLNYMFAVTQDQIDDYNERLDNYFNDLRNNFRSVYTANVFLFNSFAIEMEITNVGTTPAEDIDLYLHFPDGFELLDKTKMPKIPKPPSPPQRPKNALDRITQAISIPNLSSFNPASNPPAMSLHAPTIKKTNSYDVDYTIGNLKHHQPFQLDPLFVHFEEIRKAKGFAIDYKISVGNLPQPITGRLHVQIEIK